ncbi:MAG: hypothetical protein WBA93_15030 [Microcoleaceae cyanobacterium]
MPQLISQPTLIASVGNKPKLIDEYIGRVEGAEYIAICLPAFSPDTVNRDS